MNIISLKHWSVGTAALGILALHSVAPGLAQYYPYYSFFNPMYSYYESEDDLGLAEVIGKQDRLETLGKALQENGFSQKLKGETYTILAPTDAAFASLPPEIGDRLLMPENQAILREILNYHIVAGRITQQQVEAGEIMTLQGNTVRISGNPRDQKLMLNDARADQLPIPGPNNSVIVVIDRVLLPPGLIPLGIQNTDSPQLQTNPGQTNAGQTNNNPSNQAMVNPPAVSRTQFICEQGPDGLPTTYAVTPRGRVPVIKWYSDYFSSSGYTSEQRCREVSARFQSFYSLGALNYITHGIVNRQNVVCVASDNGIPCAGDRVLFTLKPGSDPVTTVQQLFNVRAGASSPLFESEDDSGVYIDFNNFLEATPVEGTSTPITPENNPPSGGPIW